MLESNACFRNSVGTQVGFYSRLPSYFLGVLSQLEVQRRKKEEALTMADAFRIAFEQQLKRRSDRIMRLVEAEGYLQEDTPPPRREEGEVSHNALQPGRAVGGHVNACTVHSESIQTASLFLL